MMMRCVLLAIIGLSMCVTQGTGLNTESIVRSKRGIIDTLTCTPKIISAAQSCSKDLDERTQGFDRENADEAAKCCIYTDFRRCVRSIAQRECGTDASESVDTAIRTIQGALTDKCKHYDYYSPTCVVILWWAYIVTGGVIAAILLIGCCLGACCCR